MNQTIVTSANGDFAVSSEGDITAKNVVVSPSTADTGISIKEAADAKFQARILARTKTFVDGTVKLMGEANLGPHVESYDKIFLSIYHSCNDAYREGVFSEVDSKS